MPAAGGRAEEAPIRVPGGLVRSLSSQSCFPGGGVLTSSWACAHVLPSRSPKAQSLHFLTLSAGVCFFRVSASSIFAQFQHL